jgi:competence protein ComEA
VSEHAPADQVGPPRRGVRVRAAATGVVVLALLAVSAAVVASIVTPGGETVTVGSGAGDLGAGEPGTGETGVDAVPGSPDDAVLADSTQHATRLVLHVHGAVAEPGIVELPAGARVIDAIAAARGPTDDADLGAVNLARLVVDGEQLYIPREGEVPPTGTGGHGGGAPSSGGTGLVNLNTADSASLESLPGIGPALASRIISWREQNGGFRAVDELLAVSGIGEKTLAGFRDQVTV